MFDEVFSSTHLLILIHGMNFRRPRLSDQSLHRLYQVIGLAVPIIPAGQDMVRVKCKDKDKGTEGMVKVEVDYLDY